MLGIIVITSQSLVQIVVQRSLTCPPVVCCFVTLLPSIVLPLCTVAIVLGLSQQFLILFSLSPLVAAKRPALTRALAVSATCAALFVRRLAAASRRGFASPKAPNQWWQAMFLRTSTRNQNVDFWHYTCPPPAYMHASSTTLRCLCPYTKPAETPGFSTGLWYEGECAHNLVYFDHVRTRPVGMCAPLVEIKSRFDQRSESQRLSQLTTRQQARYAE